MIARVLLLTLVTGCATDRSKTIDDSVRVVNKTTCNRPVISSAQGQSWLLEDENMIPTFEKGCVKFYSPLHCPVRVLKSGKRSYQVTCRRDN